jgi:hypothetical protein
MVKLMAKQTLGGTMANETSNYSISVEELKRAYRLYLMREGRVTPTEGCASCGKKANRISAVNGRCESCNYGIGPLLGGV